jgi:hypothetical protein
MTATSTPGVAAAAVASAPPESARTRVAAAGLALAALTLIGLLVTTPWGERNALGYDDIAPIRDSAWAGILADSLAFAIIGVTVGLVVLALVRARGSVIALVGAAATMIGGLLFAIGSYAFVAFAWYATSDAVPVETGKALLSYVDQHPEHLRGPAMIGFLLFTLGSVLLCVALLRGRAAPVAALVAFLLLTVAQFVGVEGRLLDVVQIALMLLLVGLAAWAVRVTTAGAA